MKALKAFPNIILGLAFFSFIVLLVFFLRQRVPHQNLLQPAWLVINTMHLGRNSLDNITSETQDSKLLGLGLPDANDFGTLKSIYHVYLESYCSGYHRVNGVVFDYCSPKGTTLDTTLPEWEDKMKKLSSINEGKHFGTDWLNSFPKLRSLWILYSVCIGFTGMNVACALYGVYWRKTLTSLIATIVFVGEWVSNAL